MDLKAIVTFLIFAFFNGVGGDIFNPKSFSVEINEEIALEKWKMLDKNMRSMVQSAMKQLLPVMVRSASDVELSPECTSSLLRIVIGLSQLKEFPLKMLDATAKIPSGIFSGAIGDYGNYDQCLDLVEIDEFTKEKKLQGQYCLVELRPSLPPQKGKIRIFEDVPLFQNFTTDNYVLQTMMSYARSMYYVGLVLGVCVPSSCSTNDMQNVVSHVATLSGLHGVVHNCEIKAPQVIDGLQYGLIGVIGLIVFCSVLGTVVHAMQRYRRNDSATGKNKKSILSRIFTSFSIEKNVQQLLKVEENSGQELRCIHGIRFMSMAWVVYTHSYLLQLPTTNKNVAVIKTVMRDTSFQVMTSGALSMETFFCIGGLVMSYSVLKASDSKKKFLKYLPLIIFRRIWRVLPSMLLLTAVMIIFPLTYTGPRWKESSSFGNNCRETWYLNILFISNYFDPNKSCLLHLWYLSIDMQFFILAIILMVCFWKKNWSLAASVFLTIVSIICTSAVTYYKDLFPLIGLYTPDVEEVKTLARWSYLMPTTHLASYCIGFFTGIILANTKEVKLHPLLVAACWCASTALALTVVYTPGKWFTGEPYSTAELIFYSGFHRPVFAICVSWVIFACITGYGGVVNRILSWTGFVPLSRLTFLVYLWHPVVIEYWIFRARDTLYLEHHLMISLFITYLVLSNALAFITNAMFDGPINNLTKILVERLTKERAGENLKLHSKASENSTTFANSRNLNSKQEAVNDVTIGSYKQRF